MTTMANDPRAKLERSIDLSNKVAKVLQTRAQLAPERFIIHAIPDDPVEHARFRVARLVEDCAHVK